MTPEQQRIAIAEVCGWARCHKGCEGKSWRYPDDSGCAETLPDFLNSLDAMHEAEKVLNDTQWETYGNILSENAYRLAYDKPRANITRNFIGATASQRAEAFLLTLNLWTP